MVDFTVGAKRRRVSLGSVHLQPLEKAREKAAGILLAARAGTDATVTDAGDRAMFRAVWDKLATEVDAHKLAEATRESYAERMKPILAKFGDMAVADITVADVEAFVFGLNGERNRSFAVSLIRKTINFAKKARILPDSHRNPASDVKTKKPTKRNKALSVETLTAFGRALAEMETEGKVSPWLANLFRLALVCGLRPGEVRTLQWSAVDYAAREMKVIGKAGERPIYLADEAIAILRATPKVEGCPFVFVGRRFGKPIAAVHKMLTLVQDRAKVPRFPPYAFRHTAATGALGRGVDLAAVQALLGHASIQTTSIYLHSDAARRKAAAEQAAAVGAVVVPMKRGGSRVS
ncbi:hypothetical protein CCR97_18935 [Rhodoplanes elegans]|uniref:Tyr recombinase domain-containing protein n=2 Tax=Rhodoplanes elegans TaxID=29408 RepID=A0A327KPD5_9BRAD|nr:hypothetical protein [Rhodoplanes elegans]RAI40709.1 hypothetical protein CH338_05320 [Rhodoplanes elegans]